MRFSANLGFLWSDRSLPDAVRAAKAAGFDAVECHWPYDTDPADLRSALGETGLEMLGLNTRRGKVEAGENGLSALPGQQGEARKAIDEALNYARQVGIANVHVMAGVASGTEAQKTFAANLAYACEAAKAFDRTILIEPLNRYDAPGYFLQTTSQAAEIINHMGADNLKLMFDCYHVQLMEGDVTHRLERLLPMIGHIQVASVPDRGAPDHGELDYSYIFKLIHSLGWDLPIGAEYKPAAGTEASLISPPVFSL